MGNLISLCLSAITTVLAVNDKNFFFLLGVYDVTTIPQGQSVWL